MSTLAALGYGLANNPRGRHCVLVTAARPAALRTRSREAVIRATAEAYTRTIATQKAYDQTRSEWPQVRLPEPTDEEAVAAVPLLWCRATRKVWRGTVTVDREHRTHLRGNAIFVNPRTGWNGIVHDLSHLAHETLHPEDMSHSITHADIERAMIRKVVAEGWLDGRLRPKRSRWNA
jgi:hypothetical protein